MPTRKREQRVHPDLGPAPRPVYGRDRDLDQLHRGLSSAGAGARELVLVGGESGIGKTALVEEFARQALDEGACVLLGRCYDLAMTPPYGAWVDLFRNYTGDESQHPPLMQAGAAEDLQATQDEVFEEVASFLNDVAASSTLLVVLEDQHWTDTASLDLLRHVLRATRDAPILYVVTYRDAELTPQYPLYRFLPVLVRESRPIRIELRRLASEAVNELIVERYGLREPDAGRLVDYLAEFAEGNPFFIEELLRALEHERILDLKGDGWHLGDLRALQLPPLVRQVIDSRVAWLDEEARHALEVASVIGTEVPFDIWRAVLGDGSDDALVRPVEQALDAGLLTERLDGTGYSFSHNLVREALYHRLLPPRRQNWHRRIAEVLAAQPTADVGAVAAHFQSARDPRAVEWLTRAGDEAVQVSALQTAAERYEQALYLLQGEGGERRGWLLCALAHTYRYSEPERALRYLDEARDLLPDSSDRALATAVLWNRIRVRGFLGDSTLDELDETFAAYQRMTANDRERVVEVGRRFGGIQGPVAQWLGHHGHYSQAHEVAVQSLETLDSITSRRPAPERGHALLGKALAETATGRSAEAESSFLAAYEHFAAARHHFMAAASLKWELLEFHLPYRADDPARRAEIVDLYLEHWRAGRYYTANDHGEPLLPLFPAQIVAGEWDLAQQSAEANLDTTFLRTDCRAALAEIACLRGDPASAWEAINHELPDGPGVEPGTPFFVRMLALHRIAATLAIDGGDLDLAGRWLDAHDHWLDWSGRLLDRSSALLLRARSAATSGDLAGALDLARAALERARRPGQPLALVASNRLLGDLLVRSNDLERADAHLGAAERIAATCEAPYELALVYEAQAALAQARGDRDRRASLVREVSTIAESLRAGPLIARARKLAGGISQAAPAGGLADRLTPRELEVLRLLAEGLTDAEIGEKLFISPRTVGRHLQSIYAKFEVASRTAAVAVAFEHRVLDSLSPGV